MKSLAPAGRDRARSGAPPASGARLTTQPLSAPASTLLPSRPAWTGGTGALGSRRFAIPEHAMLTQVQRMLRSAGQRPVRERTPEDNARLAAYQTINALLIFLHDFKTMVEEPNAKPLRIVQRYQPSKPGRLHLDIRTEPL